MNELLYSINDKLIMIILFIAVFIAIYIGYKIGLKRKLDYIDPMKNQTISIQSSLLGLLSLLLGFIFSIALHHFDSRNEAMKEEANAIGTTYILSSSLPELEKKDSMMYLKKYVDVRVKAGEISLAQSTERDIFIKEAELLRIKLWELATKSLKKDDRVTTVGLYIQSLNTMMDSYGTRDEALNRHIPEIVIFLLIFTIILSSGSIGYTSALSNHKPTIAAISFMIISVVLTIMLIDLDRPRRGFIQVSQKNMLDVQKEIHSSQ